MKTVYFISLIFILLNFASCEKSSDVGASNNNCGPIGKVTVTANSPVIVGWPLTLSTQSSMAYMYKWTGPNGFFVNYNYFSSDAYLQGKLTTTYADSGVYTVIRTAPDGCKYDTGSVFVKIIPPPPPPCTIIKNTSTSNVIGVGGVTYSNIYFQGGGGIYSVQSSSSGQTLTFHFNGDTPPKPGVYKTSGYFATDEKTVGCYITASPFDFINNSGQDVYVNVVAGKTQVTFCNCVFTNPLGSTIIRISANLTQP